MRFPIPRLALSLAFLAAPFPIAADAASAPAPSPPVLAIVGGTLVDGTGASPVKNARVVIRAGKIACAGAACAIPAGSRTLDARGLWITPGLVDAHVHFSQTGWADGRPDALDVRDRHPYEVVSADLKRHPERFLRSDLCSGVTAVFDVGGYPWTVEMARRERDDPAAPHVSAAGPLLSTIDFWLGLPAEKQFIYLADAAAGRAGVRYLAALGADAVKIWYIVTPEHTVEASAPLVLAAAEEAKKAGLPVIVHATGLAEAKVALKAGARLLVHGVEDHPVDDEFVTLARESGAIYCPTLTVVGGYLRLRESVLAHRVPAVDDPNGCLDDATRARLAETAAAPPPPDATEETTAAFARRVAAMDTTGAANLKAVWDAGIPVAMGTDAGNPLTLHGPAVYAEMEAMQAAGMSPMAVLVASTRGGARAMGREGELGTVQAGKDADLLLVGADPTADIRAMRRLRVVVRGGIVRKTGDDRGAPAR